MNKNLIDEYITTLSITRGFLISLLASSFIYLDWFNINSLILNSITALLFLYLLLASNSSRVWFWSGAFIGILWFWWIGMSFKHYGFGWAMPIGVSIISIVYAIIFLTISWISKRFREEWQELSIKSISLLTISYLHPFGFDWFRVELIFTDSYFGVQKWQMALILFAVSLSIYKSKPIFLLITLLAYQPIIKRDIDISKIELVNTNISIDDKWSRDSRDIQIYLVQERIDRAISEGKKLIIFPESVLPIYLNLNSALMDSFRERSKNIDIVVGALRWEDETPRNSTYIFSKGRLLKIANKVILVPFGESNPLPDWLGEIVNRVFYDGATDYQASSEITTYRLDGVEYTNAICYEGCSEFLYQNNPKNMIVTSNNGWFTPSIEPTLQKIILKFYSRKYGTTIYHSVNMSKSFVVPYKGI